MKQITLASLIVIATSVYHAQDVQLGVVLDADTKQPIGGASIRVQGTTRGTYARSDGTFRLPLESGMTTLQVRSIGYQETTIATAPSQKITIMLTSKGLDKREVEVTADIEAAEIVRRAIARAKENDERIKTLVSTTYTKLKVCLDAPEVGEVAPTESITETFAKVYSQRHPERKKRTHILQRRQTRNIASTSNLAVFDEFIDLTEPEVELMNTRMVSPLGPEATSVYEFRIVNRRPLGSHIVYELAFEPKSRIFPGFEGTLSIVDANYQVIAADYAPTDETAIPFVQGLRFTVRYEQIKDSIWAPMYQYLTGGVDIAVIADLMEVEFKLSAETYVTETEVNVPIADTVLNPPPDSSKPSQATTQGGGIRVSVRGRATDVVTVANDADSSRPEFWDAHAFAEMSTEEAEAYRKADSIVANRPPKNPDRRPTLGLFSIGPVGVSFVPDITRTSITGWTWGGDMFLVIPDVQLKLMAGFGEQGTQIGRASLDATVYNSEHMRVTANGMVFSEIATMQGPRTVLGLEELVITPSVLYFNYYDYYRRDGFEVGGKAEMDLIDVTLLATSARHLQRPIVDSLDRTMVPLDPGDYQTLFAKVDIAKPGSFASFFSDPQTAYGSVFGTVGREVVTNHTFSSIGATLSLKLPTFDVGYSPMRLDIDVQAAAVLSDSAPRQYQFSLLRRFPAFGNTTDLSTIQPSAFGGTFAAMLHAEHNFTDIWWRAIGLPTFKNKRGLDLLAVFGAGYTQNRVAPVADHTWQATPTPYLEAGFALARIPTFISDIFYLRFDALWPVGGLAHAGSFGWSLTLSSPIF